MWELLYALFPPMTRILSISLVLQGKGLPVCIQTFTAVPNCLSFQARPHVNMVFAPGSMLSSFLFCNLDYH